MTIASRQKKQARIMQHNDLDHIYRAVDHALATRYMRQVHATYQPSPQRKDQPSPTPGSAPSIAPTEGENPPTGGILKPRMDLCSSSDSPNYTARFELPGVKKEDVSIEVKSGWLFVSGDRQPPDKSGTTQLLIDEFKYGPFCRRLQLPLGVDASHITASMTDGLLMVSFPRSGPDVEPQRVQVG